MDGKIVLVLKILGGFLIGVILLLTLIDAIFPYTSIRLGLLLYLGLPRNKTIVTMLEPKQPEVTTWKMTGLYFADKDQKTLSGKYGYDCRINGRLAVKNENSWKVADKNNQKFSLIMVGGATKFYRVVKLPEVKKGELPVEYVPVSESEFEFDDLVIVSWDCPADPKQMTDKNKKVKKEFLTIYPNVISKQEQ